VDEQARLFDYHIANESEISLTKGRLDHHNELFAEYELKLQETLYKIQQKIEKFDPMDMDLLSKMQFFDEQTSMRKLISDIEKKLWKKVNELDR